MNNQKRFTKISLSQRYSRNYSIACHVVEAIQGHGVGAVADYADTLYSYSLTIRRRVHIVANAKFSILQNLKHEISGSPA